jgi:hypothetical protein
MLGAEDAGDAEEIAVEAECAEEVAGVMGEAAALGDAGRGRWCGRWRD